MINILLKINMSKMLVNNNFWWDGTFEVSPDGSGFKAVGSIITPTQQVGTEPVPAIASFDQEGNLIGIVCE